MKKDKIAIMQPYFFPYIGYFQLIKSVDKFVFYDDVSFIKKGWVNRNNVLVNGQAKLITVPLEGASQNLQINQINLNINDKWKSQFFKTLEYNYKKAPQYDLVLPLIQEVIEGDHKTISDLAIDSVKKGAEYLGVHTQFETSSLKYKETKGLEKASRLIEITVLNNACNYINPEGGMELYNKEQFLKRGIKLDFLETHAFEYSQFKNDFVPNLSIIDIIMFNSKMKIQKELLNKFSLV